MKNMIICWMIIICFISNIYGQSSEYIQKRESEYSKCWHSCVSNSKPLLVVFSAEWCSHCKKHHDNITKYDPLKKYIDCEIFYLDIEKDTQLVKRFPGTTLVNTNRGVTMFPDTKLLPTTYIYYPTKDNKWLKKDSVVGEKSSSFLLNIINNKLSGKENKIIQNEGSCRLVNGKWVCD